MPLPPALSLPPSSPLVVVALHSLHSGVSQTLIVVQGSKHILPQVGQVVEGVVVEGVVVKLGTVHVTGFPVYLSSSVGLSRCHEFSQ
jgi:hypothetical protein